MRPPSGKLQDKRRHCGKTAVINGTGGTLTNWKEHRVYATREGRSSVPFTCRVSTSCGLLAFRSRSWVT
jgi:hypothetical protein